MNNPPHPGGIIRRQCLEPMGLTVKTASKMIGVSRSALSNLLNGHSSVSAKMALRLSRIFGSTPETWLRMQTAYDEDKEDLEMCRRRHNEESVTLREVLDGIARKDQ